MTTETSGIGAPCWVRRIRVSRSGRQRLPEELVSHVSEEGDAQSQQRPGRRLLPQHPPRPVPAPERSVPQGELLAARAVPKRLSQEVVHRVARPVVHDRVGPEDDRVAGPDRADVQVDVFGRDEPLVEAADLIEDGLPICEIGRRIRDVRSLDDELHPLELLERPIADLDRPSVDVVMMPQTLPKLSDPERVSDRVSVDEGDGLPPRLPDAKIPSGSARPPGDRSEERRVGKGWT